MLEEVEVAGKRLMSLYIAPPPPCKREGKYMEVQTIIAFGRFEFITSSMPVSLLIHQKKSIPKN